MKINYEASFLINPILNDKIEKISIKKKESLVNWVNLSNPGLEL
jgi:hypothetical protein